MEGGDWGEGGEEVEEGDGEEGGKWVGGSGELLGGKGKIRGWGYKGFTS